MNEEIEIVSHMSTRMKFVVPLLDDNLCAKDFDEDIGFVGAYSYDKNRPWLDNHIFLMYDTNKDKKENYNREVRFRKCKNIHNFTVQQINGKSYIIYAFPIINKSIDILLREGLIGTKTAIDLAKIITFWHGKDSDVINVVTRVNGICNVPYDLKSVPEYDNKIEPTMDELLEMGMKS